VTKSDLLQTLACGEDSRHQFKRDATNVDGMAAELMDKPEINQFQAMVWRTVMATKRVTPQVKPQSSKQLYRQASASQLDVRKPVCGALQFLLDLRHSLACFDSRGAGHSPQQSFEAWLLALGGNVFEHDSDFNKIQCWPGGAVVGIY
jgi:hypothetical protein